MVAWDAAARQHYFRNDIDLVFDGNKVIHVDPVYVGRADRVIDGSGACVMPGMVNVHTHLQSESLEFVGECSQPLGIFEVRAIVLYLLVAQIPGDGLGVHLPGPGPIRTMKHGWLRSTTASRPAASGVSMQKRARECGA